jgi:hypothetical protein
VLVSTQVLWETVWNILDKAENLQELHLSLNKFDCVEAANPQRCFDTVRKLMFNGNKVGDWDELSKLGNAGIFINR